MKRILAAIALWIEKKACRQKWNCVNRIRMTVYGDFGDESLYHIFHYHCTECGAMRKVKST